MKNIIATILTWEARLLLWKHKPRIICVTGTVGKTSTADAIYHILASQFYTRKSEKNLNQRLRVPLTILGLPHGGKHPFSWLKIIAHGLFTCVSIPHITKPKPFPHWIILEIGAERPHDIARITSWLSPDVVVVTHFGKVPSHVEFFKSPKELIKEKTLLVKSLKNGGSLILGTDDEDVRELREIKRNVRLGTFGITHEADFEASNIEIRYDKKSVPVGLQCKVNYNGNSMPIMLQNVIGHQHIYPILAGLCLGNVLGLNMIQMIEGASNYTGAPGRMKLLAGIKNSTLIDDSYNSSPTALTSALATLGEIKTRGRKIAVLGDMLELGKLSGKEHTKAGREARAVCDILCTVGIRAREIAMGALDNGMDEKDIFQFDTTEEIRTDIQNMLQENDVILVKGSQAMRMERIVEEIMTNPEKKDALLVRQEAEWIGK